MLWFEFHAKKSTQAAAWVLKRSGGQKDKYLLLKLLYLADREAMRRWNVPITGDEPYSMEFGPVPSNLYDLTKGGIRDGDDWDKSIRTTGSGEALQLVTDPGTDELSVDEMALLDAVVEEFGHFNFSQMKEYCHSFAEYDASVGRSSRPIPLRAMLTALGKSSDEIEEVSSSIRELKQLRAAFGE